MELLGDHRGSDRQARAIHVVDEEIEKQQDSDIKSLALPKRFGSLGFSFDGRGSSILLRR